MVWQNSFAVLQVCKNHARRTIVAVLALTIVGCTESKPQASPSASPSVAASPAPASTPTTAPTPTPSTPSSTSTSTAPDASGKVSLANGRITFVVPPGFTQMSKAEITSKFLQTGIPPKYVYANPDRTVAIAVSLPEAKVTPQQLPELKSSVRQSLGKALPNLQWISDEMTTINNTPLAHLEFVNQAIDTKIHNNMYFGSLDGNVIGFNFNATVAQYEPMRATLQKVQNSITIQ